jgi:hypothetical protein
MKAQGPKSMDSPEMAMLSVFMTPWMKPRDIQWAMSEAWRAMTAARKARMGVEVSAASG